MALPADALKMPFRSTRAHRWGAVSMFALAGMFLGEAGDAQPPWPDSRYSPYSVALEDGNGNALRTFHHEGTTFALGDVGERYEVRIENHSDRRVEAVLTIDGRDAVSGDVGDFVNERGYIVAPHGSVRVDGFRRTLSETAAFRFSSPSSSYSSRMGTPENVGVIGVAFFPERTLARPQPHARRDEPNAPSRAAPAPEAHARASDGRARAADSKELDDTRDRDSETSAPSLLGTEYGEAMWSPVTEVPFQRQNQWNPASIVSLRYDDADGLVARGMEVYPRRDAPQWWTWSGPASPDPFPRNRFAPPPP